MSPRSHAHAHAQGAELADAGAAAEYAVQRWLAAARSRDVVERAARKLAQDHEEAERRLRRLSRRLQDAEGRAAHAERTVAALRAHLDAHGITMTYQGPGDTVPKTTKKPKNPKRWIYRAIVAGVAAGVAWVAREWGWI